MPRYDLIDFAVVLIGYALSGEPTLKAFYERLLPFAEVFMALFGRRRLPSRSALSRFLAALDQESVEALRTLFQKDLVARKSFASPGGLWDRLGQHWVVVDVDGTRATARQRALPQLESLPVAHRRLDQVGAPGYFGRKRGGVVRTRTRVRLIVATHPATSSDPSIGVQREGMVFELFVCALASTAFTAKDVLDLYLHRGSFEPVLADEDQEQDPDRWCSHTPWGQEFWQIVSQWIWNLRLELGQTLSSSDLRTTEFAKAAAVSPACAIEPAAIVESPPLSQQTPPVHYGPPTFARPSFTGGFPGSAFTPQADGTLRCPANHPLYPQERRPERDGSLRVLYAARIGHCRDCALRSQCQESSSSLKPRRVSALLWPLADTPSACSPPLSELPAPPPLCPVVWRDWPRCQLRRGWLKVIRSETVTFSWEPPQTAEQTAQTSEKVLTRAQRAHYRLSWEERLARNALSSHAPSLMVTLHGLPSTFVVAFGFALQTVA